MNYVRIEEGYCNIAEAKELISKGWFIVEVGVTHGDVHYLISDDFGVGFKLHHSTMWVIDSIMNP